MFAVWGASARQRDGWGQGVLLGSYYKYYFLTVEVIIIVIINIIV